MPGDFIAVGTADRRTVQITRVSDGAVMYSGPSQGPFTPTRPAGVEHVDGTAHPDWLAMTFEARAVIVADTGADPVVGPRSPRPSGPHEAVLVGRRLVVRPRRP